MSYEIETRCIHGDARTDHSYGSIAAPIYQTATYAHPGVGRSTGYDYIRESNPTRTELENTVTSLEGACDTVACSSGMAALGILMELFEPGSHFVCSEDLYGGAVRMFDTTCAQRQMTFTYVDTADVALTEQAIQENTRALYIETPSNPMMRVTDLYEMKKLADKYNLYLIVDNTFLTPYFQRPLELGADFVIHSGTKYFGGHNDTLAGFLCTRHEEFAKKIRFVYKTIGSCLSPFDSFLILRGIKTLSVRLERQQENALALARWLKTVPQVTKVYYVGLEEHPGHTVNQKQASGFGSMISFQVDAPETAIQILESIKVINYAESLGGVESLLTYPMLQTHADLDPEVRERLGINDRLLRFSVGIEHVDDLIQDLQQAFAGQK